MDLDYVDTKNIKTYERTFNINGKDYKRKVYVQCISDYDGGDDPVRFRHANGEVYLEEDYDPFPADDFEIGYYDSWNVIKTEYDETERIKKNYYADGDVEIEKFNENGKRIYYKNKRLEAFTEFDANGNQIHFWNTNGVDERKEYNKFNELTHYKSEKTEYWYDYDQDGNKICSRNSKGIEDHWWKYNEKGKCIYEKQDLGSYGISEHWWEYNDDGFVIHEKDTYNHEFWYKRDSKGREIYCKTIDGHELWTEYDGFNHVIHTKDGAGNEKFFDYNDKDEIIHEIDTEEDCEAFYIYQHDSNGNITKCTELHTLKS